MTTAKKLSGIALATAAAGLFAATIAAPAMAAKHEGQVHCMGVNGCKGKSDCATADNACKGHNACKGKGWVAMSAKECAKKGGKVEEKK
jgi:membrane-bound ClpP family serine protease